ncbi:hypothetical protein KCU65_g161, partial [Aureobasidium melanogenum]
MTTNPNLLFALESISKTLIQASSLPTTIATPLGPHRTLARPKDPRHGCINGVRISTCKICAGHVLRGKMPCTGCKGTGFVGAKCSACAIGALLAQRVLIKEAAADVMAGDDKSAKSLQKRTSTTKKAPVLRKMCQTKRARSSRNDESLSEASEVNKWVFGAKGREHKTRNCKAAERDFLRQPALGALFLLRKEQLPNSDSSPLQPLESDSSATTRPSKQEHFQSNI